MNRKGKINSKIVGQQNDLIFKQLNTNVITDFQRTLYYPEIVQYKDNSKFYKNDIVQLRTNNLYLNGTLDHDDNLSTIHTQRGKLDANKAQFNTTTNKTKKTLNRYNSYGRIYINVNNNMNNTGTNKKSSNKIKKSNNNNTNKKNKLQKTNTSHLHKNNQVHPKNPVRPISNKKKKAVPISNNNKYKTIADNNNYYFNYINQIYNDININKAYLPKQDNNTIDINTLYTNRFNKLNNMKKQPNNTCNNTYINNNNYKYINTNRQNQNQNYNFKKIDISNNNTRRKHSRSKPKTPDFNKRGKSSSKFNQRNKTPDKERNRIRLNLQKDYLYTIDNKSNKKPNCYYNITNRDYMHTLDNNNTNKMNGKYGNYRLNTNDYYKNKKTINDNDYNSTANAYNTINSNHQKKYSFGDVSNERRRKEKKLSKNSSQGNILEPKNYNINLNSNGINHVHYNPQENCKTHSQSSTNLVTPIKYMGQRSNFKGDNIQMTQIRPPNNYNIYEDTFQSFGRNIQNNIENNIKKRKTNSNNNNIYINENNVFDVKYENVHKVENNDYKKMNVKNSNNEECKESSVKNGICSNKTNYIPATINNTINKTYSYFNSNKNNNFGLNRKENKNDNIQESKQLNEIDFNDLDQFSPPSKAQQDIIMTQNSKSNRYINYMYNQEECKNYSNSNYGLNEFKEGSNRKVIDNFIMNLKNKF